MMAQVDPAEAAARAEPNLAEQYEGSAHYLAPKAQKHRIAGALRISDHLAGLPPDERLHCSASGPDVAITCAHVEALPAADIDWAFSLTEACMESLYASSQQGWNAEEKKADMQSPRMHYLIARRKGTPTPVGFACGLFDMEDDHAVFYLYELMVDTAARRTGLGSVLLNAFEAVAGHAGMQKVMLTCFHGNEKGQTFFKSQGYVCDEFSPDYPAHSPEETVSAVASDPQDSDDNCDYTILSKPMAPLPANATAAVESRLDARGKAKKKKKKKKKK